MEAFNLSESTLAFLQGWLWRPVVVPALSMYSTLCVAAWDALGDEVHAAAAAAVSKGVAGWNDVLFPHAAYAVDSVHAVVAPPLTAATQTLMQAVSHLWLVMLPRISASCVSAWQALLPHVSTAVSTVQAAFAWLQADGLQWFTAQTASVQATCVSWLRVNAPGVLQGAQAAWQASQPALASAGDVVWPVVQPGVQAARDFFFPGGALNLERCVGAFAAVMAAVMLALILRSQAALASAAAAARAAAAAKKTPSKKSGKKGKGKKGKKHVSGEGGDGAASGAGAGKTKKGGDRGRHTGGRSMAALLKAAKAGQAEASKLPQHESLLKGLKGHSRGAITAVAPSPDGRLVATAGEDASVRVTVVDTLASPGTTRVHALKVEHDFVRALAWSPCSRLLVGSTHEGRVVVWSVSSKDDKAPKYRAAFPVPAKGVLDLLAVGAFPQNRSSTYIVVGSTSVVDQDVTVLSITGAQLARFGTGLMQHSSIAVSEDGEFFTIANRTREAPVWHVQGAKAGAMKRIAKVTTLPGHKGAVRGVAWLPGRAQALTTAADGSCRRWNADVAWNMDVDPKEVSVLAVPGGGTVLHCAVAPGGALLAAVVVPPGTKGSASSTPSAKSGRKAKKAGFVHAKDTRLVLMRGDTGEEVPIPGGAPDLLECFGPSGIQSIAWAPCGTMLYTLGAAANRVLVWEVPDATSALDDIWG